MTAEGQQFFRLLCRIFVSVVITAGLATLAVIPVGDGVDWLILFRPVPERFAMFDWQFIKRNQDFVAMLADQSWRRLAWTFSGW